MARVKVKELTSPVTATSTTCRRPCCVKDPKKVPMDRVWRWSRANPGLSPFR